MTATEQPISTYNTAAIDIAAELAEVRRAHRAATTDGFGARRDDSAPSLGELVPSFNRAALGVGMEFDRMGGQPVSDELAQRAAVAGVEIEHLGLTIGTVLHGLDLSGPLDADMVSLVRDTLLERKVIFFRDQHLDEEAQIAFARNFGDLDAFPFGKPGVNPFILELVHDERSPGSENGWHTDVTWMEQPSLGSIAQCVSVPPGGGDTLFADSHAAWFGLPDEVQERVRSLYGINDYRFFVDGPGRSLPDEFVDRIKAEIPFGVSHPLCRMHPETGKLALYIHGGFLRHDSLFDPETGEQLDARESKALVRQLLAQHARPEYQCRFAWSEGSIAFWDNRAVQHYAASDYWPHRRVLRRVTVSGDRPVGPGGA